MTPGASDGPSTRHDVRPGGHRGPGRGRTVAAHSQLTNEINWYMRERNLSRADLATRMGVSPGRVSQVLSGGENLTLRTLASLATALDARFDLDLRPLKAAADAATSDYGPRPADQPPPRTVRF